jgi:hypothetical protein
VSVSEIRALRTPSFQRFYWPDDALNWPDDRLDAHDLNTLYVHWVMFGMAACPRPCTICFRSR